MNFVFILQSVAVTVPFTPCFNIKILLILSTECIYGFDQIIRMNIDYVSLNGNNQLIFIMKTHCVFFELVTEYLNSVKMNFIFQRPNLYRPILLEAKIKINLFLKKEYLKVDISVI
jgi:hypothetical protein